MNLPQNKKNYSVDEILKAAEQMTKDNIVPKMIVEAVLACSDK